MSAFDDALVLTGPTGCGKSTLAMALASRLHAEIISMDSMTLYRGMDIGTAKPTIAEQKLVPHHLIDVLDPWESANVSWWLERAKIACVEIRARGKRPLFVGGTPFYLMALLYGLFDAPPADEAVRQRIEGEIEREGAEAVHARLVAVDPVAGKRIHFNDNRRVVRALEVFELTGKPLSSFQLTWDSPGFTPSEQIVPATIRSIRIDWPREELYARIDRRVEEMIAVGWVDECRQLLAIPEPLSREARAAIGYRELFAYLKGTGQTLAETVSMIQQKTRQFAKRQLTWFRRMNQIEIVSAQESNLMERIESAWNLR